MGFFLTDMAQSAFTPPGTNARRQQEKDQGKFAHYAQDLAPGEYDYLKGAQQYRAQHWGDTTAALDTLAKGTTQKGRDEQSSWFQNTQTAGARDMAGHAGAMFGGNPDLAQGFGLDQMNQANSRSAQYQGYLNSPEAESQAMNAWLQGVNGVTNYNGLSQLGGLVYGQPQVNVGAGLGDFLGSAASGYFSGQGHH
jgi:hypothetical protein